MLGGDLGTQNQFYYDCGVVKVGYDDHRLDRLDNDGLACLSLPQVFVYGGTVFGGVTGEAKRAATRAATTERLCVSGEGGIRTHDPVLPEYTISNRAH